MPRPALAPFLLVSLTVLLVAPACAYLACALRPGAGGSGRLDPVEDVQRAQQRKRELEREGRAIRARIQVREQATAELLAGRCTLPEAAAVFRDIDDQLPSGYRSLFEGDAEKRCRRVINWLQDQERATPEELARLDAELGEHLCRGDLKLPPPR
jgi:hypothetical protein